MKKLEITFTGLCSFVPNQATPPNQMRVLAFGGDLKQWQSVNDIHIPVLLFQINQFDSKRSTKKVDFAFKGQIHPGVGPAVHIGACLLENLEVQVVGARPQKLSVIDGALGGPCPDGDDRFFSWVMPIKDLMPRCSAIDVSCLRADPPSCVASRMQLLEGTLRTLRFASSPGRRRWQFGRAGHPSDEPHRAIADVVGLSAPIRGRVELALTALRQPAREGRVRLRASKHANVNVSIRNLPLQDILGLREGNMTIDRHFDNHYRFSANDPGQWQGRVPHRGDICSGGIVVRNPSCPLAQYDPHGEA